MTGQSTSPSVLKMPRAYLYPFLPPHLALLFAYFYSSYVLAFDTLSYTTTTGIPLPLPLTPLDHDSSGAISSST